MRAAACSPMSTHGAMVLAVVVLPEGEELLVRLAHRGVVAHEMPGSG